MLSFKAGEAGKSEANTWPLIFLYVISVLMHTHKTQ